MKEFDLSYEGDLAGAIADAIIEEQNNWKPSQKIKLELWDFSPARRGLVVTLFSDLDNINPNTYKSFTVLEFNPDEDGIKEKVQKLGRTLKKNLIKHVSCTVSTGLYW